MGLFGIFSKKKKETLDTGLEKTKDSVLGKISRALAGKSKVDDEVLDNLEDVLISSDVGVDTTLKIIKRIEERVARDKYVSTAELNGILRSEIEALLTESGTIDGDSFVLPAESKPYVIMVVGVNGVGKTTTIGKLAYQFKAAGHKVVIGAADTFRAAAAEQLETWGSRVGVDVVRSDREGADPASVAFESVEEGIRRGCDVVMVDTAGRLQTKSALMDELGKVKRVMEKHAPVSEVLLVLDATTGQNGLRQAEVFAEVAGVTGIVLSKLDGSAKGGIVVSVQRTLGVPVKFVGLGEGPDDLAPFDPQSFVDAIVG